MAEMIEKLSEGRMIQTFLFPHKKKNRETSSQKKGGDS